MTSHTEPLNIEQQLFNAAAKFVKQRYPQGWGGAGAVYTEAGSLLISVAPEVINDATHLCMETGAYLEAHKLNERVTHSSVSLVMTSIQNSRSLHLAVYARNDYFTGAKKSKLPYLILLANWSSRDWMRFNLTIGPRHIGIKSNLLANYRKWLYNCNHIGFN